MQRGQWKEPWRTITQYLTIFAMVYFALLLFGVTTQTIAFYIAIGATALLGLIAFGSKLLGKK